MRPGGGGSGSGSGSSSGSGSGSGGSGSGGSGSGATGPGSGPGGGGAGGTGGTGGGGAGGTGGGGTGGGGTGGAGGTGGSWGDPHLTTFDGIKYDFQGAGEYTFVKSTTDDLEIQTRQQPWNGSNSVTVNTAIAIKSGGQRIGLYLNDPNPLKINGTAVTLTNGALYAVGQNVIIKDNNSYNIYTANNDLIKITLNSSYIDVGLGLADNRKTKVVGLLGNYNGTKNDDFAKRDGTIIGGTITDQELYGDYGNSWRITQANSLFNYATGQNTSTFTNLNFPPNIVTYNTLTAQQKAAALQIAQNAGITDPQILEDAILDIALTNGATEFIQGYTEIQRNLTVNGDNTLINPDGEGSQHYLTSGAIIPYTIRFSNNAESNTTPVAKVTVSQTLDSDLDLNTFTLEDFGFGDITIDVPVGVQNYSQRLDLRNSRGVFVDVNANLNTSTRVVTWTFTAIDPATGNTANSATQGFLPPNDANGSGRGIISYSIQPKADSLHNTRIDAQASITFNSQTAIQTNPVFNTLEKSTFDIDGDGQYSASVDGLLFYGYLNVRNLPSSLRNNLTQQLADNLVTNPNATRKTGIEIGSYIESNLEMMDVDGNGQIQASIDGLLAYGYMNVQNLPQALINNLTQQLVNNLIPDNSTAIRDTGAEIVSFMESYMT